MITLKFRIKEKVLELAFKSIDDIQQFSNELNQIAGYMKKEKDYNAESFPDVHHLIFGLNKFLDLVKKLKTQQN